VNLGNTCFLNSVLQCLLHAPLLENYFSSDFFSKIAKTARFHTQLLQEVHRLFIESVTTNKLKIVPNSFYREFLMCFPDMQEGKQHDSHEFLLVLLSLLHEALTNGNKAMQMTVCLKTATPTEEAKASKAQWDEYRGEKGSIVSAIFGSQMRNELKCTKCGQNSTIFEVFNDFSIPVPAKYKTSRGVLYVVPRLSLINIGFPLFYTESDTIEAVLSQIETKSMISARKLVFCYVRKGFAEALFQPLSTSELFSFKKHELFAYEIQNTIDELENLSRFIVPTEKTANWRDQIKENWLVDVKISSSWKSAHVKSVQKSDLILILHTKEMEKLNLNKESPEIEFFGTHTNFGKRILQIPANHIRTSDRGCQPFGTPLVISIGSWLTWHDLLYELNRLIKVSLNSKAKDNIRLYYFLYHRLNQGCGLCSSNCRGCRIPDSYDSLEPLSSCCEFLYINVFWSDSSSNLYNPAEVSLQHSEEFFSLHECFAKFTEKEIIELHCNNCGGYAQESQVEIWRLPDVLVIHLKRFSYVGEKTIKLNTLVKFPVCGLDLSFLMLNAKKKVGLSVKHNKDNYLYDLFAVVNHAGTENSGHNTAYCRSENGEWLFFDDDRAFILSKDIEQEIISHKAYILFYKRQRFRSANILTTMNY
jgi:ubiquitin C-terminal hydrolase